MENVDPETIGYRPAKHESAFTDNKLENLARRLITRADRSDSVARSRIRHAIRDIYNLGKIQGSKIQGSYDDDWIEELQEKNRRLQEELEAPDGLRPQWAQRQVKNLLRHNEKLEKELSEGPGESDTFMDPMSRTMMKPLGMGARIRFGGPEYDHTVDAYWKNSRLLIQGNAGFRDKLVILPRSGNTFEVAFRAE